MSVQSIESVWRRAKAGELRLLLASIQSIATGLSGQLLLAISGPLVARLLGMSGRGYLAALNVWPVILVALGSLSIPSTATYFLSRRPSEGRQIAAETYRIALVQAAALSALLFAIFYFWSRGKPPEVQTAIYPTLLLIPAGLAQWYAVSMLQGRHRFTACNILRELPAAVYAVSVLILFILGERRLLVVQSVWVATSCVIALAATVIVVMDLRPDWHGPASLRRELVVFGLRGYLGSVAPISSLPVDQAVVALVFSASTLGLYAVAYAFTNLPLFVAVSAGIVSYPAIAARGATMAARRLLWRFFWGITLLNAAGAFILILLLPILVRFFFGQTFAGAVPIARILLIGTTVAASRRLLVDALRGLGRPGASTIIEVSMYPWLLVGAPLLMLHYGVLGLAASLGIGYGVSLLVALALTLHATRSAAEPLGSEAAALRVPVRVGGVRSAGWLRSGRAPAVRIALFVSGAAALGALVALMPFPFPLFLAAGLGGVACILVGRRLISRTAPGHGPADGWDPRQNHAGVTARPDPAEADDPEADGFRFPRLLYYTGSFFLAWLTFRPAFATTLSDWLFLASLLATAAAILADRRSISLAGLRPIWAGIALFSIGAIASSFGADSPVQSLAALARFAYLVVVWIWLGTVLLRTLAHLKMVILLWVVSAATSGAAAVAQFLFGNVIPGSAIDWGRMPGFAPQVNDLGGTVCVALIPALMIVTYAKTGKRTRLVASGAVFFLLAGLMLSGSVGGFLAAATAVLLWLVADRLHMRLLALLLVIGVAGFLVVNFQQQSGGLSPLARVTQVANSADPANATLFSRLDTYRAAWNRIESNPVIGAGLDPASAMAGTPFRVHDMLLGAWFEAGIIGALGVAVLLISIGAVARRTIIRARSNEERLIAIALLIGFLAFVVYLLGEPFLYERYGWIPAALILVLSMQQRRAAPAPSKPIAAPETVIRAAPVAVLERR